MCERAHKITTNNIAQTRDGNSDAMVLKMGVLCHFVPECAENLRWSFC